MAAEVETMFYAGREKPWHGLGTQVDEAPTSAEAIRLAGLDWKVNPQKIYLADGTEVPNFVANTRDTDNSVFGVVTDKYKIVQNSEAFDFTDALIGEGVKYETAGSLFGGRKIWLLAKTEDRKVLDDAFENYIVFTNAHDGKGAIRVAITNVRVVCNNTLNVALNSAKRSWSTKHMGDIQAKLKEAQRTLELSSAYLDAFAKDADRMAHTEFGVDKIEKVLNELFPTTADLSERQLNNNRATREAIYYCYNMADIAKYLGTQYGFINAVADFADHATPNRLTKNYAENNFDRIIDGHAILDKCYDLSNALVTA